MRCNTSDFDFLHFIFQFFNIFITIIQKRIVSLKKVLLRFRKHLLLPLLLLCHLLLQHLLTGFSIFHFSFLQRLEELMCHVQNLILIRILGFALVISNLQFEPLCYYCVIFIITINLLIGAMGYLDILIWVIQPILVFHDIGNLNCSISHQYRILMHLSLTQILFIKLICIFELWKCLISFMPFEVELPSIHVDMCGLDMVLAKYFHTAHDWWFVEPFGVFHLPLRHQ